MTALDAVSVYTPAVRVPIESLAEPLGLTDIQVRRFHGLGEISLDPERSPADLPRAAIDGIGSLRGREHLVRYVVHGRAMPVVVPYPGNPPHEVCREADPDPDALVLAGEKAFTRDARPLPGTSIPGEGAPAGLVSALGPRDRMLSFACAQRGGFDTEFGESAERLQRECRPSPAGVIREAVDKAGLELDDIALVLPHNVDVVTWQRLCLLMNFPVERVLLSDVPVNGHLFCSDAFANHTTARERGLLREGDRYLVAAVGAGAWATFSAMVFQH